MYRKAGENVGKKKIGAMITLDGGAKFREEVKSCNKSLSTMKSELNLVKAETVGNANSLEALQKKHEVLNSILDTHVRKQEKVEEGLTHAKTEYARVGSELETYKKKLQAALEKLDDMKKTSDTSAESIAEQQKEIDALNKAVDNGEQIYKRAGDKVQDWTKQLNNAKAQVISATKAVNENAAYVEEAKKSSDGYAKSIDNFGNKTDTAVDKLTEFKKVLEVNVKNSIIEAGKDALGDLIQTGVQGALELQESQKQLQASTGATTRETKEYAKEMAELYTSGYGDSINDVADAMALVKQYTNETDPTKLKELAENGIALQDVFDMDLSEQIRGIDALMTEMGVDADKAFDLVAKGAQNGLNKSGELTDNLAEYTSLYAQAGFSAEEMFAIMENGLNSGAYNLDKVNDYVKEFGVSLSDGRIEQSLGSFSTETQTLFREWQSGRATTKDVFQSVISDLSNMTNEQQALTIASNTWSSLGEDNAMKVITSLNNVNNTYKNVHGTMEEIKDIKYDTLSNQWKTVGRSFQQDIAAPIIEKSLPTAEKTVAFIGDHLESMTVIGGTLGSVMGTLFVAKKAKEYAGVMKDITSFSKKLLAAKTAETVAEKASTAAKTEEVAIEVTGTAVMTAKTTATTTGTVATIAQTAATKVATIAQGALNAVMSANPVVLLAVGVGTLVTALSLFGDEAGKATSKTDKLAKSTEESIETVEEATKSLKKSSQGWKESLDSLNAKEGIADNLITELYKLDKQTDKSSTELSRMDTIVAQLNSMFPNLALEIDKSTGALNKNEKQTKSSIDTSLKYAKAQAAQEKMADIANKLVDAQMAQTEAEEKLEKTKKRLNKLDEERNRILEFQDEATFGLGSTMVEYNGEMMHYQTALRTIETEEAKLKNVREEQKEALGDLKEEQEKANSEYEKAYNYTQGITEETEAQNNAIQENTDKKNANTVATNENSAAAQNQQEKSKASIEVLGQETEAYRNLSVEQQNLAVEVTNAVTSMQESVTGALESQMDMFEKFDAGTTVSKDTLLQNMQSQIDGVVEWERQLTELSNKGINQGLLQKLIDMGPEGTAYVSAFNTMTSDELGKANELWTESIDIKGMTNDWGQQLLESGAASVAGGMENLNTLLEESGANTVTGLVKGMQEAQKQAEAAGNDLGIKTVEAINTGLGCHSPSTKTKESGINSDQGLILGMKMLEPQVGKAAKGVAGVIITNVSTKLTQERFETYGKNVTEGLVAGIKSGKSDVVNAIADVCGSAITEAKETLEIHSPSHVFRGMANNTMESYVLGVREREKMVQETVRRAVNFTGIDASINMNAGSINRSDYNALQQIWTDAASQMKFAVYLNGREVTRELSRMGVVFNAQIH